MDFVVDAWDPGYGTAFEAEALEPSTADVDCGVEMPPDRWRPVRPAETAVARSVGFVDGVRRIDARVWITGADGQTSAGIAASFAAGIAHCDGVATVESAEVRRGVFSAAPDLGPVTTRAGTWEPRATDGDSVEGLSLGVQQRMTALEAHVAHGAGDAELLVVDGPLRLPGYPPQTVGYVKTHHASYLPAAVSGQIGSLQPGERTPLFLLSTPWAKFCWYARLPAASGHAWAGIVRGEVYADMAPVQAAALADRSTATLPRFSSTPHKDPRAPQNLHPIAALERALRRRLGDHALIYRSLRQAASVS